MATEAKVRFYRVHLERHLTTGMYQAHVSHNMHELDGNHPCPQADDALRRDAESKGVDTKSMWSNCGYYGFRNLQQFRHWVYKDRWIEELTEEGFAISVFEVPTSKVALGNTQAIMLASKAKEMEEHRIKTVPVCDYLQLDQ